MSMTTIWDHLFVAVVFIAYPIYTWWTFPSFIESAREKGEPARISAYRETITVWLVFSAALLFIWVRFGRGWADLGVRWGDPFRFGLGVALGLGLLWITRQQILKLASADSQQLSDQLGKVFFLLPRGRRELAWFRAMSVNAGVTEELIYRGFLLWYLEPLVGIFWAAVLAVVAFTLAHAYQGLAHVPALAFASTSFVALYLLTGSLLLPILLHALLDALQGSALARFFDSKGAAPSERSRAHDREIGGEQGGLGESAG